MGAAGNKHPSRRKPPPILKRDGDYIELADLDLAGYLFAHDLHSQEAYRVTRYKFQFVFYDPHRKAEGLVIEFINSCCADTCDAIARLKRVIRQFSARDEDILPNRGRPQPVVESKKRR